jgi:hypothetical protein
LVLIAVRTDIRGCFGQAVAGFVVGVALPSLSF